MSMTQQLHQRLLDRSVRLELLRFFVPKRTFVQPCCLVLANSSNSERSGSAPAWLQRQASSKEFSGSMASLLLESLPLRPVHSSRLPACPVAALHCSSTCNLSRPAAQHQASSHLSRRPLSRRATVCQARFTASGKSQPAFSTPTTILTNFWVCQAAVLDAAPSEAEVESTPEDSTESSEKSPQELNDELYMEFNDLLLEGGREFETGDT